MSKERYQEIPEIHKPHQKGDINEKTKSVTMVRISFNEKRDLQLVLKYFETLRCFPKFPFHHK